MAHDVPAPPLELGFIGFGDMNRLYARAFFARGFRSINVCDLPGHAAAIAAEFPEYNVLENGHLVSRRSDVIFYGVEAKNMPAVIAQYGPSTKLGAIVGGQTSVKAGEVAAFSKHLPDDVHIVTFHSLHGPAVSPHGQPLVLIRHRASDTAYQRMVDILSALQSKMVELTAEEHDTITADTQAVTHVAFMSMGAAWAARGAYPWSSGPYVGGIENVKVAMALRIFSAKAHVYSGLALLNPSARAQIAQYAASVRDLFGLIVCEHKDDFRRRIAAAAKSVFGNATAAQPSSPILLSQDIFDAYQVGEPASDLSPNRKFPNSHLALLAMVDCWHRLGINPYTHLICQTPPFRLWLGITEFLFRNPGMLDDAIQAALECREIRADDLAFVLASSEWASIIQAGHLDGYHTKFEQVQEFFKDKLIEGRTMSAKIIEKVASISKS